VTNLRHAPAAAPEWLVNAADGSVLRAIPGGVFTAGEGERAGPVALADFYLARLPVTSAGYARFCDATGHRRQQSYGRRFSAPDAPVVGVGWDDAVAYGTWAGLRLPSELEWERAATFALAADGPLHESAWFADNSGGHPQPAGHRRPNGAGLHDMLGNVWEWTADWYDDEHLYRVVRGGSWKSHAEDLRPAHRDFNPPVERMNCIGFRCARDA
jgi:formylglycine-generating enzyme required for sulfatase activity